ncbi:MAG: bifunctional phosphoribosyl-AMP cyclohydrolase/phosphoribosyl-ATP diphosphatase HisIE [Chloroflexota bacterium]|nr:bifunctional phosphoribosyl-AMP cyclohydrolase/phosphoribosyl-ATP diphosphatase HisIE [Chloroflexota bacterium]
MLDQLNFNEQGLIAAIVQHHQTKEVLMMAFMNREALERTLEGEHVWFWSRRRQELWEKGATSGNYLLPKGVMADCDGDAVLVYAEPTGPICHTGASSCFFEELATPQASVGPQILDELADVIDQRKRDRPEGSYTARLLNMGMDRIAKKVGEEAAEVIIAGKNGSAPEITWEVADLWYHTLVLLASQGVPISALYAELARRR